MSKRKVKQKDEFQSHGCSPFLAGYWSSVYGLPREAPDWLPGHKHREFKRQWRAGYDAHQARVSGEKLGHWRYPGNDTGNQ